MQRTRVLFALAAAGVLLGAMFSVGQGELAEPKKVEQDKWFVIRIDGKTVGYVHAVNKASGNDPGTVRFEHEYVIDWKDEKVRATLDSYCEDNLYYYPIKMRAIIEKPGKPQSTLTITVKKKVPYGCSKSTMRLVYRNGDAEYKFDKSLPAHVVSEYTLLEIVPTLPFVKGTVFEFDFLILETLKVRKRHKITYLGLDKVQIRGTQQTLHKFEQKGGGIKKVRYWVDEKRQLVRVLKGDKRELLISTRAEARQVVVGW